jgi:hypothetical protein
MSSLPCAPICGGGRRNTSLTALVTKSKSQFLELFIGRGSVTQTGAEILLASQSGRSKGNKSRLLSGRLDVSFICYAFRDG